MNQQSKTLADLAQEITELNESVGRPPMDNDTPTLQVTDLATLGVAVSAAIVDVCNNDTDPHYVIDGQRVWRAVDGSGADWTTDPRGVTWRAKTWTGVVAEPRGLPNSLAQILLRVVEFAARRGIDLDEAVQQELVFGRGVAARQGGQGRADER